MALGHNGNSWGVKNPIKINAAQLMLETLVLDTQTCSPPCSYHSWTRNCLLVDESDSSSSQTELGAAPGDILRLYSSVCCPSTGPLPPAESRREAGGKSPTNSFGLQAGEPCPRLRHCCLWAPLPHPGAIRQLSSFYRTTLKA